MKTNFSLRFYLKKQKNYEIRLRVPRDHWGGN